jgi:subtilisin family serine protease
MNLVETQWALDSLQIASIWQLGYTGVGVSIGHLDTGLDKEHPVLRNRPLQFKHFDRNGFPKSDNKPFDSAEHGTQTASLICGRDDNFYIGVAPDCDLHSAVVLEEGSIIARILFAMDWMLECQVRVLCIPLGIPGYSPVFASMIRLLRQRGILTIAAIGNRGAGQSLSPGNYPEVISVGAIDVEGNAANFSGSYHRFQQTECLKPDLLAPGVDIQCAIPGGTYALSSGTSMACALVAGVAALLIQAAPNAPLSLIEAALLNTCSPLPNHHSHRSNRGIVNPEAALHYVLKYQNKWSETAEVKNYFSSLNDPLAPPHKYIDTRLHRFCQDLSDDCSLEAVFIISEISAATGNEERSIFSAFVDRITQTYGESIKRIRCITDAGVVILLAPVIAIRSLMLDPLVRVASAVDVNRADLS